MFNPATLNPPLSFPAITFCTKGSYGIADPNKQSIIWVNSVLTPQSPSYFPVSSGSTFTVVNTDVSPKTLWVTWIHGTNVTWTTATPSTTVASSSGTVSSSSTWAADSHQGNPTSGAVTSSPTVFAISSTISPSSTSSPNIQPKSKELSGGAVAGVAIGCLIAGALIAGLVAWLCLKRRRSAARTRYSETSTVALMHHEKGPVAHTAPLSGGIPTTAAVDSGLPQPLEDKAISAEISKISNLMKNHVQSYYHGRTVNPRMLDSDDLKALGDGILISLDSLSSLLNSPKTREIALRFCIASVVTARMQLNEPLSTTFLPPEISKCLQSMPDVDRHSRGKYTGAKKSSRLMPTAAHSVLLSKWRAITAELTQSVYASTPFAATDPRLHNIQIAMATLDNILRPYVDSRMDDTQRSRNLQEILKRAAQFAFTLFSQPSSWRFDWNGGEAAKSGSLCIFPALVQVTDENGQPLDPPRSFNEAVVRKLDE